MRCRMVGRWSVPNTAAAVANSGAETRAVAVAAKWRAWLRVARMVRTAPMRPGMGRGFVGAGVVGAVRGMGLVVAGSWEQSKNIVITFLIRGIWDGIVEADLDARVRRRSLTELASDCTIL